MSTYFGVLCNQISSFQMPHDFIDGFYTCDDIFISAGKAHILLLAFHPLDKVSSLSTMDNSTKMSILKAEDIGDTCEYKVPSSL